MKKVCLFLAVSMMLTLTIMIAAYADDTWTCENGHEGNTGKFCSECGAARPDETAQTWTCENGHEGNTGKFCSECGAPKPAEETWTCKNGHEGNTGDFCKVCGAPKPKGETPANTAETSAPTEVQTEAAQPETSAPEPETTVSYDNPFPDAVSRFTIPFSGIVADHQVALNEVLSHADPSDEIYVEYVESGKASEQLAWDKYSGNAHDLYLIYQNGGQDVYAYAYMCEFDSSKRTEWASGSLFPNPLNAVSSVLWVESGEDNDVYSKLLDQGSEETDYEAVKSLIRSLDPDGSAQWFSHQISMMREETEDGMDRYWVIFHNTDV